MSTAIEQNKIPQRKLSVRRERTNQKSRSRRDILVYISLSRTGAPAHLIFLSINMLLRGKSKKGRFAARASLDKIGNHARASQTRSDCKRVRGVIGGGIPPIRIWKFL